MRPLEAEKKASRSTPTKRNSFMRQPAREKGVDIVTPWRVCAYVREYEALAEGANVIPRDRLARHSRYFFARRQKSTLWPVSGVALTTRHRARRRALWLSLHGASAHSGDITPQMRWKRFILSRRNYQDTWAKASVRCELPV